MSRPVTLGYAVSTVEGRLLQNSVFIDQLNSLEAPVVIVNQFKYRQIDQRSFKEHIRIINTQTKGLSISRNMALSSLESEFAMLCDDDIKLEMQNIPKLESALEAECDIAMFFTQLQKSTGELWRKDYEANPFYLKKLSVRTRRRIQRINSMEQVYNVSFLKVNNLQFNEYFGVGSQRYIQGEETLMSLSVLRASGTLKYLPLVTRVHPPFSSGHHLSIEHLKANLAVQIITFGPLGLLSFSSYVLRSLIRYARNAMSGKHLKG